MYIYAFPVMMAVHAFASPASYLTLAALTFCGTLPLASLSWHLVEKPSLALMRGRLGASSMAAKAV
jgi:peptidoglycan/LPS O-acetylase OafA/YrhL